jgi:hypothetical protein
MWFRKPRAPTPTPIGDCCGEAAAILGMQDEAIAKGEWIGPVLVIRELARRLVKLEKSIEQEESA